MRKRPPPPHDIARCGIVGRSLTMKESFDRSNLADRSALKGRAPTVSGPRAGGAGSPTWFPLPLEFPGSGRTRRRSLRDAFAPQRDPQTVEFSKTRRPRARPQSLASCSRPGKWRGAPDEKPPTRTPGRRPKRAVYRSRSVNDGRTVVRPAARPPAGDRGRRPARRRQAAFRPPARRPGRSAAAPRPREAARPFSASSAGMCTGSPAGSGNPGRVLGRPPLLEQAVETGLGRSRRIRRRTSARRAGGRTRAWPHRGRRAEARPPPGSRSVVVGHQLVDALIALPYISAGGSSIRCSCRARRSSCRPRSGR